MQWGNPLVKCEPDKPTDDDLAGQRVCVTGRLAAMTHGDFASLVQSCGGQFLPRPIKGGFLLVIGGDGWPARHDGSPSIAFERARRLRAYGYPIEFVSEEEFFGRIGFISSSAALRARHTVSDLTRILGVTAASVRRWERMGLIRPVETVHRFSYYSFSDVASARRLSGLLAGGATLAAIRRGLEEFRTWLPAAGVSFSQLALIEQDGRLLLRLNGALVSPSRQHYFDFESGGDGEPTALAIDLRSNPPLGRVDELFDRGLALEDQGRFEEAAEAYRQASELAPRDPCIHFNLGNALYAQGQYDESVSSFRASLDCDPDYAEAWNNLGNALWKAADRRAAAKALRRALELIPDYADARHNLSALLDELKTGALRVVC